MKIVVWGGGLLENRKPEDLKRFNKHKKQKEIVIGSIIAIVMIIGGISLYRSFAMYEEKASFDVLKGTVPDFASGDITLAYTVDGITGTGEFPTKELGYYGTKAECKNGATADWSNKYWGLINVKSNGNKRVVCNITFETNVLFRDYIISQVSEDENLIKVEHEDTVQTGDNATTDYRYNGSNPDNYVYFGCEADCTDDNLYRIIGVIPTQSEINGDYENRVKLIKNDYYTESESGLLKNSARYNWNSTANNKWEESSLNTKVLNGVYWNSLNKENETNYQDYIDNAVWYLGAPESSGNDSVVIATFNGLDCYKKERSNTKGHSKGNLSTVGKIGLMYPSDVSFSINEEYWEKPLNQVNEEIKLNSWIMNNDSEWTISPEAVYYYSLFGVYAWRLDATGSIAWNFAVSYGAMSIRPTFYLKASVLYKDGDGSIDNPYQIDILE